jgi:hypothetical protein
MIMEKEQNKKGKFEIVLIVNKYNSGIGRKNRT